MLHAIYYIIHTIYSSNIYNVLLYIYYNKVLGSSTVVQNEVDVTKIKIAPRLRYYIEYYIAETAV